MISIFASFDYQSMPFGPSSCSAPACSTITYTNSDELPSVPSHSSFHLDEPVWGLRKMLDRIRAAGNTEGEIALGIEWGTSIGMRGHHKQKSRWCFTWVWSVYPNLIEKDQNPTFQETLSQKNHDHFWDQSQWIGERGSNINWRIDQKRCISKVSKEIFSILDRFGAWIKNDWYLYR